MAGLVMGCEAVHIFIAGSKPFGWAFVDGCKVEGEVTYFDRVTPLPGRDDNSQCIVNLGTFRTFIAPVVFETVEAEIACVLLDDS